MEEFRSEGDVERTLQEIEDLLDLRDFQKRAGRAGEECADDRHRRPNLYHRFLKRMKARLERRRAMRRPDCRSERDRHIGYKT
jgi:hypothetical protein